MIAENSDHLERCSRRFAVRAGIAEWMTRRGYPRPMMAGALVFSAAAGLACSVQLARLGLSAMWLRYPLAFVAAYAMFVCCLGRLAIGTSRRLDSARREIQRASIRHQTHSDSGESKAFEDFVDGIREGARHQEAAADGAPAQITLLLALTVVLICIYYIWMAPILWGELIAEGALVAWIYRPVSRGPKANWLQVAFELTGMQAFLVAAIFTLAGLGFQLYAPRATTVVEVWQEMLDRNAVQQPQAAKIGQR